MSDIKRHKAAGNGVVKADPKGDLVLYIDYARLKEQHDFYKSKWEEKNDRLFRIINLEQENARLKESLRLQIEQNALAQVGFKMYQNNVDSGGLHKDRKDAIARLEAENARLKAEVERLTKAGDAMASTLKDGGIIVSGYALADEWLKAKLLAAKGVQS